MADKEIAVIITEMYVIASELLISPDKVAQEHGNQLRKLIEQLKHNIADKNTTAE